MSTPRSIDLPLVEAARLLEGELLAASENLRTAQIGAAQDKLVSALGLALQLGPAPVNRVLLYVMQAVPEFALSPGPETLSILGPALVQVVGQVQEAGALPPSRAMEAWATVASDVGTIIGQVGLALTMKADRRQGMMANARLRAFALDEATGSRFAMTDWIDHVSGESKPRQSG